MFCRNKHFVPLWLYFNVLLWFFLSFEGHCLALSVERSRGLKCIFLSFGKVRDRKIYYGDNVLIISWLMRVLWLDVLGVNSLCDRCSVFWDALKMLKK